MESKIEIELTEKEASHLRTLLEGGIKISDSISQGEVFKNILDHLNSQDQEVDKAREEGYQNCMDDIWEKARGLRSWTEHDGSVSAGDIEAGLREAYLEIEEELSKLTTK